MAHPESGSYGEILDLGSFYAREVRNPDYCGLKHLSYSFIERYLSDPSVNKPGRGRAKGSRMGKDCLEQLSLFDEPGITSRHLGDALHEIVDFLHHPRRSELFDLNSQQILSSPTVLADFLQNQWSTQHLPVRSPELALMVDMLKARDEFEQKILKPAELYRRDLASQQGTEVLFSENTYRFQIGSQTARYFIEKAKPEKWRHQADVEGRFDHVRAMPDGSYQIWEFKYNVDQPDAYHALQLAIHGLASQVYVENLAYQNRDKPLPKTAKENLLMQPDLILYSFYTGKKYSLQITDVQKTLAYLRNTLFYLYIAINAGYSCQEQLVNGYSETDLYLQGAWKRVAVSLKKDTHKQAIYSPLRCFQIAQDNFGQFAASVWWRPFSNSEYEPAFQKPQEVGLFTAHMPVHPPAKQAVDTPAIEAAKEILPKNNDTKGLFSFQPEKSVCFDCGEILVKGKGNTLYCRTHHT